MMSLSPVFEPVRAFNFISLFEFDKLKIDILLVFITSDFCDYLKEKLANIFLIFWEIHDGANM